MEKCEICGLDGEFRFKCASCGRVICIVCVRVREMLGSDSPLLCIACHKAGDIEKLFRFLEKE